MTIEYGNVVYYGDGGYYRARIDYTLSYPSDGIGRFAWAFVLYHNTSLNDSNNSAGNPAGDLRSAGSWGSYTYNRTVAGTHTYSSGTTDIARSYYATVDVDQDFWVEGLADLAGGGARSTAQLRTSVAKRAAATPETPATPTDSIVDSSSARITMVLPADRGSTITQTYFALYTATTGGTLVAEYTAAGVELYHDFTGLTGATTYYAEVKAKNGVGWSAASARDPFTTASATAPDTPAIPTFTLITSNSARMNWVAPAEHGSPITGYVVQNSTDNTFVVIDIDATVGTSPLYYDFTGLEGATPQWGRVAAISSAGNSGFATDTYTTLNGPPDAPGMPVLVDLSATDITVTVPAPAEHGGTVTGCRIQVSTDPGFGTTVFDGTAAGFFERLATGCIGETEYHIRALATSTAGDSDWSPTLTVTTLPGMWANDGAWKELELWFNDAIDGWIELEIHSNDAGIWNRIS